MTVSNDRQLLRDYNQGLLNKTEDSADENHVEVLDAPAASIPKVNIQKPEVIDAAISKHNKAPALLGKAVQAKKTTNKVMGAAVPSLDDFPVPTGGIGLLVFISLLMVFAITPIKDKNATRLQLIWGSVLGKYSISSTGTGTAAQESAPAAQTSNIIPLSAYMNGGVF